MPQSKSRKRSLALLTMGNRYVATLVLPSFLLISLSVHALTYTEISAEIELISYVNKGTNGVPIESRRTYPLKCIVGTNDWRIESEFLLNGKEVWYFDGTNVYHSIQVTKPSAHHTNSTRIGSLHFAPFEEAKSNLTVVITPSPGGHPLGNLGVNIPWLAFGSGTYLKREGRLVPLPTTSIRDAPDSFAYSDKTDTFDDDFGLPRILDLFTSKAQYESSLDDERLIPNARVERARSRRAFPFKDGILKFHYEVEGSTNFYGWNFPTVFSYVQYQPNRQGNWQPFVAGRGRLISLRESGKPENVFVPELDQKVVDFRFRDKTKLVDGIIYSASNATVAPSTADPALRAVLDEKVKRAQRNPIASVRLLRWMIGTLIILPLVIIAAKFYRTNTKSSNNKTTL